MSAGTWQASASRLARSLSDAWHALSIVPENTDREDDALDLLDALEADAKDLVRAIPDVAFEGDGYHARLVCLLRTYVAWNEADIDDPEELAKANATIEALCRLARAS